MSLPLKYAWHSCMWSRTLILEFSLKLEQKENIWSLHMLKNAMKHDFYQSWQPIVFSKMSLAIEWSGPDEIPLLSGGIQSFKTTLWKIKMAFLHSDLQTGGGTKHEQLIQCACTKLWIPVSHLDLPFNISRVITPGYNQCHVEVWTKKKTICIMSTTTHFLQFLSFQFMSHHLHVQPLFVVNSNIKVVRSLFSCHFHSPALKKRIACLNHKPQTYKHGLFWTKVKPVRLHNPSMSFVLEMAITLSRSICKMSFLFCIIFAPLESHSCIQSNIKNGHVQMWFWNKTTP